MDSIDKWLKSLRLHKYTHLFKSLTYEQMLNLEEKYLIDMEVTKGARNKMLISIKKLNLRQERLINMIDDLNHDNISMKEALTTLKDILLTPIPPPPVQYAPSSSISSAISSCSSESSESSDNCGKLRNFLDPYELTYLFVETLEKVAQRLIESAGMEDNACHGIMAAIFDECLKHDSFTKEQKARVASFKPNFIKEQQKSKMANFKHNQQQQQLQQQQHQLLQSRQRPHTYNNYHHYHNHHNHLHHQPQLPQQAFKEYSLLGPGMTFELPCLRALAAAEKHNRRQLCFLSR